MVTLGHLVPLQVAKGKGRHLWKPPLGSLLKYWSKMWTRQWFLASGLLNNGTTVFDMQLFECSIAVLCHIFCIYIPIRISLLSCEILTFRSSMEAEHLPHYVKSSVLKSVRSLCTHYTSLSLSSSGMFCFSSNTSRVELMEVGIRCSMEWLKNAIFFCLESLGIQG